MIYLLMIPFLALTYVAWTYIHEYAHLLMTKRFVEVKSFSIKAYPHNHPTLGFVFGSVSYDYEETLTDYQLAWCSFAPRIPDLIGCVLFTLDVSNPFYLVFFGGALVDLVRGSLPLRPTSDICRYCGGWGWSVSAVAYFQILIVCGVLMLKCVSFCV